MSYLDIYNDVKASLIEIDTVFTNNVIGGLIEKDILFPAALVSPVGSELNKIDTQGRGYLKGRSVQIRIIYRVNLTNEELLAADNAEDVANQLIKKLSENYGNYSIDDSGAIPVATVHNSTKECWESVIIIKEVNRK